MSVDPTNRASIRKAEKAARIAERERRDVIAALMQHVAGRKYIYEKLEGASIFKTTFSTNALQMAFNEGNRNAGLQLLVDLMAHCPDQYILMMREANDARSRSDTGTAEHNGSEDGDGSTEGPVNRYGNAGGGSVSSDGFVN